MHRYAPAALIIILLIAFRLLGSLFPETFPNFQPLAALFFCGALMASGWRAWAIPLGAWLITYPAPALIAGNASWITPGVVLTTGLAFAATFFIGKSLSKGNFGTLLLGSVTAAISFHVITNGIAWAFSPLYAKNLGGLWQSLWTGPALSEIPNWVFLRNMTAANVLFTAVFLSARLAMPAPAPARHSLTAR